MSERSRILELAAAPGVRDPVRINAWIEGPNGEPISEPGRKVEIRTVRADGKPERYWRRK